MTSKNLKMNLKNMLRILYDDFDKKVKNIHDEMYLHHSYKKKEACSKLVLYMVIFKKFSFLF